MEDHEIAAFYAEHAGRDYYGRLARSVGGSCGVAAMVIEGEDAIAAWRRLMGPTDPARARETAPGTLRARFGRELPDNAVHGSDSAASAGREIQLLFPDLAPQPAAARL